jgi:hypothetical protein
MVKKRLERVVESEAGKGCKNSWTGPLRALLSSLAIIVLLPAALAAQAASPTASAASQATVYGSGYQLPLEFERERAPADQVSLRVGASAFYDDNVLGSNADRLSDEALSFDAGLGIQHRTDRLTLNFDYVPFFILYRQVTGYDRVNHALNLSLSYRLSSRFLLALQDDFSYQNGVYPTLTEQPILSGPPPPDSSNGIINPYSVRTLADRGGLYLTFMKSRRTSIILSGAYNQSKYGASRQYPNLPLYNGTGLSGGLTLQHHVTAHTSLGVLALHQDTTYQGGQILGNRLHIQIESAYISFASLLAPGVKISLFGGPQYVRSVGSTSSAATLSSHFQPSGGGSITKEVRKTALDLTITRSVTDGGGLYSSVVDTRVFFGVRRRLVGLWEARVHADAAREETSLFRFVNGRIEGLIGGVSVSRPLLARGATLRFSYESMHQLNNGVLPSAANFDRNQLAVGFDYQLKGFSLGR